MPDSAQQTFIQVGPAGEITYDFQGHISADGLDLQAVHTGGGPAFVPEDRKVRWLREADGAVVAEIAAVNYSDIGLFESYRQVRDPDNLSTFANLVLQADGPNLAQVRVDAFSTSSADKSALLLRNDGASDFAYLPYVHGNTAGGADVTFTFTLPRDNMRVLIGTHATAYASAVATSSIRNDLDGVFVGDNVLFINVTNQHLAYSNLFITRTNLAAGNHSMRIRPSVNCLRDGNDYNGIFVVAL